MTLHKLMERLEEIRKKYGNPKIFIEDMPLAEVVKAPDKVVLRRDRDD